MGWLVASALALPASADMHLGILPDPAETAPPEAEAEVAALRAALSDRAVLDGWFADLLETSGVELTIAPAMTCCRGYFDAETNRIGLLPGLAPDLKLLIAAHELRHVDQYRRGFVLPLDVDRREATRLVFAIEADAQAIAALYAWSAREAGRPGAWEAFLGLERYHDIPEAFAATMAAGGDLATATRAAFSTWYASDWRRQRYYYAAGARYLDALEGAHRDEPVARLPPDRFDGLCLMPGGDSYGCETTEEITRTPRP
jgi:hypothetical protein